MPGISLFLKTDVRTTQGLVETFQEEFETMLKDLYTDDELEMIETKLDAIGAVYVHSISSEISFDDFYFHEDSEKELRGYFNSCRSMITIENLPYLENNVYQVTYLKDLLKKFDDFIVDVGGVSELMTKEDYINYLSQFKDIDGSSKPVSVKPKITKQIIPVDPIDFLILDVNKEFERLKNKELPFEELSEKVFSIYAVLRHERIHDNTDLLKRVGLNAKDLDDGLERLKFWLRKF